MHHVLTDVSQATSEWLTDVLRRRGVLHHGQVELIERRNTDASSNVYYLTVHYSRVATSGAPEHLVLKLTDPELESRMPHRNRTEVALCQALTNESALLPIVQCYDAVYVPGQPDRFHLLLEDPSATTHFAQPYSAAPPTQTQCRQIIRTLAHVHARFWSDLTSGASLPAELMAELQRSSALADDFVGWVNATLPRFLADLGERISPHRHALYARLGAAAPARLIERQASGRTLTLTHGDVHVGNFLYPRDPAVDHLYMIDWKGATIVPGANDLAYMMALYWFPDVRRRWEEPLLREYHQHLIEHGVVGYQWEDLWDDYRLAVLRQFFEAVWGWSVRQNSMIWWNHLERISLAIDDLRCLEVL